MLNKKATLNFTIGLIIALLLIFGTIKIISDIAKYRIEQKDKESFLKVVSSVNQLSSGERNYEFLRMSKEGSGLLAFAKNNDPITFYNDMGLYGYVARPKQCEGVACLCYCNFVEIVDYYEKNPHNFVCDKAICKGLTSNIAKTYTQDDFKLPGTWREKYKFENGFVVMQKVEMGGGDLPFIHPLPPIGLPLGVELHFERGPDYVDFCFESKCI